MGTIALIRQTYLDGQWYKTEGYKTEKNLSLDAWNAVQGLPQIFEAGDKLDVLRIARIGEEFGVKYIVKSAGDGLPAHERNCENGPIRSSCRSTSPKATMWRDPFDALNVSLKELKTLGNGAIQSRPFASLGRFRFSLTCNGLKDKSKFLENLRKGH